MDKIITITPRDKSFHRWLSSWMQILDGIIGVLSLGIIYSSFHLETVKYLLKRRYSKGNKTFG